MRVAHRPENEYESFAESFSNYDVIDGRIDVSAQKSLIRLKSNPATSGDATAMLSAVKSGRLAGIYGDDLLASAQLAALLGTVRWELVLHGRDAALIREPNPAAAPNIIFRTHIRNDSPRLDRALLAAWAQFGGDAPIIAIPHRQFGYVWSVAQEPQALREAEAFSAGIRRAPRTLFLDGGEANVGPPPSRQAPLRLMVPETGVAPWRWICSLEIAWGIDPDTGRNSLLCRLRSFNQPQTCVDCGPLSGQL
jgi:hypothetical protein